VTERIAPLRQVGESPGVMRALADAARATGADFNYLVRTAQKESGFDPSARARTSSAAGLFQFTADTWLRMVERYGERHGLGAQAQKITIEEGRAVTRDPDDREAVLALREDPELSARMAGELARENALILRRKIGREPTQAEIYAAHFLGPSGASKLIEAARIDAPGGAGRLFPAAARANRTVFENPDGVPLTARALYARLTGDDVRIADGTLVRSPPADLGIRGRQSADGVIFAAAPAPPQVAASPERFGAGLLSADMISALFRLETPERDSGDSA